MSAKLALVDDGRMHTDTFTSAFTDSQLTQAKANDFVRLVSCLVGVNSVYGGSSARSLSNEIDLQRAFELHLSHYPRSVNAHYMQKGLDLMTKAASNPGTTLEPSWAAPLAALRPLSEAFVELARPASLIGKLTTASRVPFNVSIPTQIGGGTYAWVGQGAPKPVGSLSLESTTLEIRKAAGLLVLTEELVKLTAPSSIVTLRREMIRGMSKYLDAQFTDPTVAPVGNVSPGSITYAAPSIASAGSSAANAVTDIKKLIETFIAANPDANSIAILMSPGVATAMAVATGSQTLGPNGGQLFGVDVHTGAIGSRVVILDPSALLVADDGELDVTTARHASVEMESAPTSPVASGTVLLNLWTANLVGLKIDRFINWKMARANAVLYTNVAYV